jgi:2-phospho-L-lactate guanylyltransferase
LPEDLMLGAVVPLKSLAHAKERLACTLSPEERMQLCLAMLADVLEALNATPEVSATYVVTVESRRRMTSALDGRRVRLLEEPDPAGLNEAVRYAAAQLRRDGIARMLVVPADLPLVEHRTLGSFISRTGDAPVGIVPDRGGRGTALLLLNPPTAVEPRFGPDSYAEHLGAARARGLRCVALRARGATRDVDTPADIAAVLPHLPEGRTRRVLEACGIPERLRRGKGGAAFFESLEE